MLITGIVGAFVVLLGFDYLYGRGSLPQVGVVGWLSVPPVVAAVALLSLVVRWPAGAQARAPQAQAPQARAPQVHGTQVRRHRDLVVADVAVAVVSAAVSVAQLIAGDITGMFPFTETAGILALILVSVRWLPVPAAALTTAALAVVAAVIPLRIVRIVPGDLLASASSAILMWLLGCGIAAAVGGYLRAMDQLRARTAAEIRRTQRLELARDLHDFVAHHVSGIVVQAQAARVIADRDPRRAIETLSSIEEAGIAALASLRRTVGMLREQTGGGGRRTAIDADDADPGALNSGALNSGASDPGGRDSDGSDSGGIDSGGIDSGGIGSDEPGERAPGPGIGELPAMVERFGATGGIRAELAIADGVSDALPPEVTTSAYRIVLEALTNVRKHARDATTVVVRLDLEGVAGDGDAAAIAVRVEDNGSSAGGSGLAPGSGYGLTGLAERVDALDGTLTAAATATGWRLEARLPL